MGAAIDQTEYPESIFKEVVILPKIAQSKSANIFMTTHTNLAHIQKRIIWGVK